jgi:hypothetical protein
MHKETGASLVIAVVFAGCVGSERPAESSVVVTDSAGITIVANGVLDDSRNLLASSSPALQLGVVAGAEEMQLYRVADVKRLSDGAIAVANGGSRELRIYNADGSHRATAGGAGRGPSEFRYPSSVTVLPGDTIQIEDFMDRVYFTANGDYVRRESADRGALAALWAANGGSSEGGSWLADGTFFAPVYHWDQKPPSPGPLARPNMTFVRVSSDLAAVDTLGEFGGILQQYVEVGGERGVVATVPPFATNTSWALGSADGTVVAGDNAAPQIDRFLPDGSHMIVRWSAPVESVSAPEIEAWKDLQRNAEWTQGQLPALERAWAAMDVPETKPYYGRVATGSDGTIWVGPAEYDGQSTTLRAFSRDGRFQGTVSVPGRFTPYDSGPGWMLGILRDENDVELVQVFELKIT